MLAKTQKPKPSKPSVSCRMNPLVVNFDTAQGGGGRGGGGGGEGTLLGLSTCRITNTLPVVGKDTWELLWTFTAMSISPNEVLHATLPSCICRRNMGRRVSSLKLNGQKK